MAKPVLTARLVVPSPIHAGVPFTVDASSSTDGAGGGGIRRYFYNFGDDTKEATDNPTATHTYRDVDTYPITVTVTNKKGKSNTCEPVLATVTAAPPVEPPIEPPVEPPPDTGLVPEMCRTVWAPGVRVVPPRDVYVILNTGDAAFINDALQSAPPGMIVGLGDGVYNCNDWVALNRGVTLRGNGPGRTILEKTNGAQNIPGSTHIPIEAAPVVLIGPNRWPKVNSATSVNLFADGIKGDYTIWVADASGFVPGQFVFLDRDDYTTASWLPCPPRTDPATGVVTQVEFWGTDLIAFAKHNPPQNGDDPFPASLSWFSRPGRPLCEIKEIAAVAGNAITFTTPLHAPYLVSRLAQLSRFDALHVVGAGLEALTVRGGGDCNIYLAAAAHCWLRDIESTFWVGHGVRVHESFRCTVRDSYIHDGGHPYPGGSGYNLSLTTGSSDILVENNVLIGTNKVIVANSAGAGSVVAYNYTDNNLAANAPAWVEVGINGSHMVGGHHILFEGNQSHNYDSDDTHGNALCMTIFRNHLVGRQRDVTGTQNMRCAGLMFGSWWHAFIGNVLGEDGRMAGWLYDVWNAQNGVGSIYKFGYTPKNWTQGADPKVLSTVLRDGNFDYLTNAVAWDRAPQDLPDSLYLTAKPDFFEDLAWPWVDPIGAATLATLPARARYEALLAKA